MLNLEQTPIVFVLFCFPRKTLDLKNAFTLLIENNFRFLG